VAFWIIVFLTAGRCACCCHHDNSTHVELEEEKRKWKRFFKEAGDRAARSHARKKRSDDARVFALPRRTRRTPICPGGNRRRFFLWWHHRAADHLVVGRDVGRVAFKTPRHFSRLFLFSSVDTISQSESRNGVSKLRCNKRDRRPINGSDILIYRASAFPLPRQSAGTAFECEMQPPLFVSLATPRFPQLGQGVLMRFPAQRAGRLRGSGAMSARSLGLRRLGRTTLRLCSFLGPCSSPCTSYVQRNIHHRH